MPKTQPTLISNANPVPNPKTIPNPNPNRKPTPNPNLKTRLKSLKNKRLQITIQQYPKIDFFFCHFCEEQ